MTHHLPLLAAAAVLTLAVVLGFLAQGPPRA